MTKKIILLNAPPDCGKDNSVRIIKNHLKQKYNKLAVEYKFAKPLKTACYSIQGHLDLNWHQLHELIEETKKDEIELPVDIDWISSNAPFLMSLLVQRLSIDELKSQNTIRITQREFLIFMSEDVIKPMFGQEFFGNIAASTIKRLLESQSDLIVISDFGFMEEVIPLINNFPPEQMVNLQLERTGIGFAGDSRSYVDVSNLIDQHRIVSNTIDELAVNISAKIDEIMKHD